MSMSTTTPCANKRALSPEEPNLSVEDKAKRLRHLLIPEDAVFDPAYEDPRAEIILVTTNKTYFRVARYDLIKSWYLQISFLYENVELIGTL
jgi:hypothetical protein